MRNKNAEIVNFNQINRDKWVAALAKRLAPGAHILDVGAGECRYKDSFSHCEYRTQDFRKYEGTKQGILKDDWNYGQIDYVSEITTIPVPNSCFDAILCTEVLEHVPEPIPAIQEFHRILKPNGSLFISAPLGSGLHQQPYHFYGGFTPHFYNHFLGILGFDLLSIKPNGGFFLLLLQEINRGINILRSKQRYPRWHPTSWLLEAASSLAFAKWMAQLDQKFPIYEFTVGYHIEAVKVREERRPT